MMNKKSFKFCTIVENSRPYAFDEVVATNVDGCMKEMLWSLFSRCSRTEKNSRLNEINRWDPANEKETDCIIPFSAFNTRETHIIFSRRDRKF